MRSTGRPFVVTLNGLAEVVLQDAAAYQAYLVCIAQLVALAGLRGSLGCAMSVTRPNACRIVAVVIVTSSDSPRDPRATKDLGASTCFRKQTDFDEFMPHGVVRGLLL